MSAAITSKIMDPGLRRGERWEELMPVLTYLEAIRQARPADRTHLYCERTDLLGPFELRKRRVRVAGGGPRGAGFVASPPDNKEAPWLY